jgi:voltage-dependent potassium channel beta subunit
MHYNRLGDSGLKLSRFSIGSWVTFGKQVDLQDTVACLRAALDGGVNFIDNAEAYAQGQAEVVVGQALRQLGVRREDLVLSSKVYWGGSGPNDEGLSRKHVTEACHAALRRLQVDYLDLYLCHRPDPHTPVLETALTMDLLIRQGKVLYWGTSEWSADQLAVAYKVCERHHLIPPQVEQPEYNLFHRDRVEVELVPHLRDRGLGLTTWSPLASGFLSGKYAGGVPAGSRASQGGMPWLQSDLKDRRKGAVVEALRPIAADLGATLAQLALAWCARNPHVSTVITGATRPAQVAENLAADALVGRLDEATMRRVELALAATA